MSQELNTEFDTLEKVIQALIENKYGDLVLFGPSIPKLALLNDLNRINNKQSNGNQNET